MTKDVFFSETMNSTLSPSVGYPIYTFVPMNNTIVEWTGHRHPNNICTNYVNKDEINENLLSLFLLTKIRSYVPLCDVHFLWTHYITRLYPILVISLFQPSYSIATILPFFNQCNMICSTIGSNAAYSPETHLITWYKMSSPLISRWQRQNLPLKYYCHIWNDRILQEEAICCSATFYLFLNAKLTTWKILSLHQLT